MPNSRTPLSPTNRDALQRLEQYRETLSDDSILTQETAVNCLTDDEFAQAEAAQQIAQLLLKGYLYEVDEEIRIPPRPYD